MTGEEDGDWDTPFPAAAPASASSAQKRQSDSRPKGFHSKADRDPLKLFLFGLEPNLEESGVRSLLTSNDCPAPIQVAFRVRTVKEDRGEVQRAFAFVDFACRKEAANALDILKKANVKSNYAELSVTPSGIRSKVADFAFDSFRKSYTPAAKENVSDLISKFESVAVKSDTSPVTSPAKSTPLTPRSAPDVPDSPRHPHKDMARSYSINSHDTGLLIGQLVQVMESADSVCKTCVSGKEVQHMHYILQDETLLDPADAPPAMQQLSCSLCHTDAKLMKCTGCDRASYCSRACQVKDWPQHRRLCSLVHSPAPSATASPALSLNYSAQMSPNGTLERITAPLTNGSVKLPVQNGGGGDEVKLIRLKSEVPPHVEVKPAPKPAPKLADVADGTTPVRHTTITRTRIEEPASSGRPVTSRTDSESPAKASPGQMMRDMLSQPLSGKAAEPPAKKASPSAPQVTEEQVTRKLVLGQEQTGLVVWQDQANDKIFFLSGDEDTIYEGINPEIRDAAKKDGFVPKVGSYILARSTDDNELYRAQVTAIRGDDVAVVFIDYGNEDNVKVSKTRPVPAAIDPVTSQFPPQAVRITYSDDAAKSAISSSFNNATELRFTPIEQKDGCYVVSV